MTAPDSGNAPAPAASCGRRLACAADSERLLWIGIAALVIVKLWLTAAQSVYAVASAGHDDALFVGLARNLIEGQWLGRFNNLTLAKGVFYPLFLAGNFFLGLPLLATQHLVYLAGCAALVALLRRLGARVVLLLPLFALLAFNPSTYYITALRVIRDYLYGAETLIVAVAMLGLLRACEQRRGEFFWALLLGLAMVPFWLTREEGIWILPAYGVMTLACLVLAGARSPRAVALLRASVAIALPFAVLAAGTGMVKWKNHQVYGVAVTTEFQADYFRAAWGALTRVEHAQWRRYVQVPREVREQVYAVSPAFAELQPHLEGPLMHQWVRPNCGYINPCNDHSSHFMWALRDAVAMAGHYRSATEARDYYRRLAGEVNRACDDGRLRCGAERRTMAPVFHRGYLGPLADSVFRLTRFLVSFRGFSPVAPAAEGPMDRLRRFEEVAHHHDLAVPPGTQIKGWAFSPDGPVRVQIRGAGDGKVFQTASLEPSPDVYAHLSRALGIDADLARNARFDLRTACETACELAILVNDQDRLVVPMADIALWRQAATHDLYLNLETAGSRSAAAVRLDRFKLTALSAVAAAYDVTAFLLVLALACFAYAAMALRRNGLSAATAFAAVLLTALVCRLALLAYLDVSTFHGVNAAYNMPTYVLIYAFIGVSLQAAFEAASRQPGAAGS
jgi:hypothetical protein